MEQHSRLVEQELMQTERPYPKHGNKLTLELQQMCLQQQIQQNLNLDHTLQ